MKKGLGIATLVLTMVGCATLPTSETMTTVSYSIGAAAGLVANQTKIDDASKSAISDIIEMATIVLPEADQTFADAWKGVAEKVTAKYIENGKITEAQQSLIVAAVTIAGKGVDYLFTVRYPAAKEYTELVNAGLNGFSQGFLSTFKVENTEIKDFNIDVEAFEWLNTVK